ncbi:MAG: hypothetical protein AB1758_25875, partial [Candidatus Eremiobacterota bacterium]
QSQHGKKEDLIEVQFQADQTDRGPEWLVVRGVTDSAFKLLTEGLTKGRPVLGRLTAEGGQLVVSALRFQAGQ